jgi:signal transduction histidine kinase
MNMGSPTRGRSDSAEAPAADREAIILAAYREEKRRTLAGVAPGALATFVVFALGSGVIEYLHYPVRWRALILLNTTYFLCGLAHAIVLRWRPSWTVPSTLLTASTIHLAIVAYFTATGGSAELCVMILGALLTAQVAIYPWDAAGQFVASIAPVLGYAAGLQFGMELHVPVIFPTFSLLTMVLLTTVGAGRLDRHRFESFRRARLLEWTAEEERHQRALVESLLNVARAMNLAIGDPQRLTHELAEHTRRAMGVDFVLVHRWLHEPKRYVLAAAAGAPEDVVAEVDALGGARDWAPLLAAMTAGHGAVEVDRSAAVQPLSAEILGRWGIRRLRIQSVARERKPVGLITCARARDDAPFSDHQHRTLAAIATQAAVALENAGLVEASRAAERLKDEFVATVSHELRTPLNVILGYTDLILEGTFGERPAEETDALQRVRARSLELYDLIQDLLNVNRLESRGRTLSLRQFAVTELIDSVRRNIPANWMRPEVQLCWGEVPASMMVRSDFGKLEIVVRNLIHNALKFTERGTVHVGVEASEMPALVHIVVTDTGRGIARADLAVIFEMFGQTADGTRADGVGLGLYIVKRLADLLGGTVDVDSEPGRGSRFTFTVPAASDE